VQPDDEQTRDDVIVQLSHVDPYANDRPLDPAFLARIRARTEEYISMSNTSSIRRRRSFTPLLVGLAAAAGVVVAIGVGVGLSGDDSTQVAASSAAPSTVAAPTTATPTTVPSKPAAVVERPAGLEPAPAATDPLMAICAPFDPIALSTAPVAFDGVVTAINGTDVTFEVTKWFRGGSGVVLDTDGVYMTGDYPALIGGAPAVVGERYLVAAELYSDAVRPGSCGWVQSYTPEAESVFQTAFGA
jgi:hypothetical protein